MRKSTKLLIMLPFVMTMLTGCVKHVKEESISVESISEVESSEESLEESVASEESVESIESIEESTSTEESSEDVSVEESSEEESIEESVSEEESIDESVITYTAEGVIQDICIALFGEATLDDNYFSDGADGFYTGVSFGAYGEEYLGLATTTIINNLPDYCVEVSAPAEDTWEDGSKGVFAIYSAGEIIIQIGSYVYNGKLCAQVNVF